MNTMNMPGFTAEASLYRTTGCYQSVASAATERSRSAVVPQGGFGTTQKVEPARRTITYEPEECATRCFFYMGVRLFCYVSCY